MPHELPAGALILKVVAHSRSEIGSPGMKRHLRQIEISRGAIAPPGGTQKRLPPAEVSSSPRFLHDPFGLYHEFRCGNSGCYWRAAGKNTDIKKSPGIAEGISRPPSEQFGMLRNNHPPDGYATCASLNQGLPVDSGRVTRQPEVARRNP